MTPLQIGRVVGGYAIVAVLYILLSDYLVATWLPDDLGQAVGTGKGVGFVVVTALSLAALLYGIAKAERKRYVTSVQEHPAPMVVSDPSTGSLLMANPAAEALLGRRQDELRQGTLDSLGSMAGGLLTLPGDGKRIAVLSSPLQVDGKVLNHVILRDETAKMAAEARLSESERRFRHAIEEAPLPALIHAEDGEILGMSRAWTEITGYTREEVRTIPDWVERAYGEKGPKVLSDIYAIYLYETRHLEGEYRVRTKFGERIWEFTSVGLGKLPDGRLHGISMASDVTERVAAEQALRESEELNRSIVENAPDLIFIHRAGKIVYVNPAGVKALKVRSEEDIVGKSPIDLLHPDYQAIASERIAKLMQHPGTVVPAIAVKMVASDGVPVDFEVTAVSYIQRGHLEVLVVCRDLTPRIQAEAEIRALNEALRRYAAELEKRVDERTQALGEALERATEADRMKSVFLATMSHELRTPLNSILGFSALLLQGLGGPLTDEQARQLRMVQESGEHLLMLINDVLDISRIEAGQMQLASAPFDVYDSVRRATSTLLPMAETRGLEFRVVVPDAPLALVGDRRRFEQIVLNLVSNALKFTDTGSVHVSAAAEGRELRVVVADTGRGIAEEDLAKLFRPFSQLDNGLARQHEGTGLGLVISQRLAQQMAGRLEVRSEVGKGSTFTLALPLEGPRA